MRYFPSILRRDGLPEDSAELRAGYGGEYVSMGDKISGHWKRTSVFTFESRRHPRQSESDHGAIIVFAVLLHVRGTKDGLKSLLTNRC